MYSQKKKIISYWFI